MTFGIIDNAFGGFLTFIAFVVVIISLGDSIRRIFNMKILTPILDSIIFAILSTVTVSVILEVLKIYSYYTILIIVVMGLLIELKFVASMTYFRKMKTSYLNLPNLNVYIRDLKKKLTCITFKNKLLIFVWTIVIIYQIVFIIFPAIVYPLPLEDDMKQHSLFLQLIVQQNNILPSWTPTVPLLGSVLYQLGGHIYASVGYYLIEFFQVPTATFMNFWFRINFIACFYALVFLSNKLFSEIPYAKLFTAVSLVVLPTFFWITRWGGYTWILGFIFMIYIIQLSLQTIINDSNKKQTGNWINQLVLIFLFGMLALIHSNVFLYAFVYLNIFCIHLIFKYQKFIRQNLITLVAVAVLDIAFVILIVNPLFLLQILPENIKLQLLSDAYPSIETPRSLYEIFIVNFFLGGLFSLIGIIILLLYRSCKNDSVLFIILNWIISLIMIFFILQLKDFSLIKHLFFYFPGANFVTKAYRLLYFVFFVMIIFSPIFWRFIEEILIETQIITVIKKKYLNKNIIGYFSNIATQFNKNYILPIIFVSLVFGSGILSFYSLQLPNNRNYSPYTLDAYQFIQNNVPAGSYILNDRRGQWLPLVANVRISFPADPLELPGPVQLTLNTFYDLFMSLNNVTSVNISSLLSTSKFNAVINYIFVTTYVFNDLQTLMYLKVATTPPYGLIWDLSVYNGLNLIYKNPEVAIYKVNIDTH